MIRVCHAAASRTSLTKTRALTNSTYKTAREYVRIKIDGLRLVGGNPDFTNAPGHGDRGIAIWESSDPKTRFDYSYTAKTRVYIGLGSQRVALLTRPRFLDSARA